MNETFDFVIVGAGSAGCALAARLRQAGPWTVLLLEAGPPDSSPWIHFPLGLHRVLSDERIEWRLPTAPEPALGGRRVPCPRGRTLGGSSAANGMVYVRGQPQHYDAWAAAGCTGWGWNEVLPYFRRSEGNQRYNGPLHGRDGPLKVSSPEPGDPLCEALIASGTQMGWPRNDDFNGAAQEGVGYYQHTLAEGRRWSAARAYLQGAGSDPRLTIRTGVQVRRVVFEGTRAVGVEIVHEGQRRTVSAAREVILSAGAIHTPQLLQVSGVGVPAQLQALGVAPVAASPEVGLNLQDHLQARLRYVLNRPLGLNALYHRKLHLGWQMLRYVAQRRGRCAAPPIRSGAFCRSAPELARPDLQFHFIEFTAPGMGQPPHRDPGFWSSVCVLRPRSRGHVRATAPGIDTAPEILGNYLQDPEDARLMLAGVRLARRLAAQPALAALVREEADPGPGADTDAALLDWVRATAVTVYHPVGTCRMGGDARAVVDPSLRVRGTQGLRIADASVMPSLVSGNTNAPAMMIGEKAADLIAQHHRAGSAA